MKFRHHRGGLKESMETTVDIGSMEDLKKELAIHNPQKIEFQHRGMDTRVNWDTYYVIADDRIVGMSNSDKF